MARTGRRRFAAEGDDYRGVHQGPDPEYGAPMHDPDMMFPDYHAHPEYYRTSREFDHESESAILRAKGKPDGRVTVYRALPLSARTDRSHFPLNTGDWVTPSLSYAREHGESNLEHAGPWTVLWAKVPASQLFTEGNSIHEWAYQGEPKAAYEEDGARRRRYRRKKAAEERVRGRVAAYRSRRQAMPTVYHGTTPENAEAILRDGFRPGWPTYQDDGGYAYFTTEPQVAAGYGDAVVAVDLPDDVYDRVERHQWSDDETVVVPPAELKGLPARVLSELPHKPLSGVPGLPKVYRRGPGGRWLEGVPGDRVPLDVDEAHLDEFRSLPDWPAGTFDDGPGTYWDADFGDGMRPYHQRRLHSRRTAGQEWPDRKGRPMWRGLMIDPQTSDEDVLKALQGGAGGWWTDYEDSAESYGSTVLEAVHPGDALVGEEHGGEVGGSEFLFPPGTEFEVRRVRRRGRDLPWEPRRVKARRSTAARWWGGRREDAYDLDRRDLLGPDQTPVRPGPWFHGSPNRLEVGDVLDGGHSDAWPYGSDTMGAGTAARSPWLFMSPHPAGARFWAGPYVYRVEPLDEGPYMWNDDESQGFVSPRARVVEVREGGHDEMHAWADELGIGLDGRPARRSARRWWGRRDDAYDLDRRHPEGPDQTPVLPGPWFHATDAELQVGDLIEPHYPNNWAYGETGEGGMGAHTAPRDDWVFMTRHPGSARMWAGPWVYRVEPLDEGPYAYNDAPGEGFVAPRARVVEVRKDEWGDEVVGEWAKELGIPPKRYYGGRPRRRDPHHGEGPWYHGTSAEFVPGQVLLPGDTVGKAHGRFSDGTRVWVSNDPVRASAYGFRLYEVEPQSRPRSPYANHDEHHTTGATVVREVPAEELARWSATYDPSKGWQGRRARRTAMPTYYHHTREPDFRIDYDREPDNAVLDRDLPHGGRGLWVSPDPDRWRNYNYRGRRPYLVELHSDEDLGDDPAELFVGGDRLRNMRVVDVRAKDARRRVSRRLLAEVTDEFLTGLQGEFDQWWAEKGSAQPPNPYADRWPEEKQRGPVGYWPYVEAFFKDRYPGAHKGFEYGLEDASHALRDPEGVKDMPWLGDVRYESGPEAEAKYGYDPSMVAAGMVLLHTRSHPNRRGTDLESRDEKLLADIFEKRMRMQRQVAGGRRRAAAWWGSRRQAMPRQDAYGNNWDRERQTAEPTYPKNQVWYHRSDHDLPDGTVLVPSGGKSRWDDVYHEDDNRRKWVWMSTPDMEWFWGLGGTGKHLYQVEPMDEGPYPWNDDESQFVAPRARIIRKLKQEPRAAATWWRGRKGS